MTRVRRGLRGLLAYVRPTFMFPAVGMSAYGSALASPTAFEWSIAVLHAGTVGLALLVAHLRDGYVDGHLRGEEVPRLGVGALKLGIGVGTVSVLLLSGVLAAVAGALAALSTGFLLALALLHAPYLDRHPVTVTTDYPLGIGTAVVGGYAAQSGGIAVGVAVTAALFVCLLSGIKVGIDRLDRSFDASIGKRTVPIVLGSRGADLTAVGVFLLTALATAAVGLAGSSGSLPVRGPFAFLAASTPLACLFATLWLEGERAVRVQMASTYVFAVGLFVSVCTDGCAGGAILERAFAVALG
ncbi:hypothetical protein [Halobellus salinisoli]|uniref:hypothetical protein n=1 Tax=Halobellus salinisoli TaxID=3108500 RepID=UPI00300AF3E2